MNKISAENPVVDDSGSKKDDYDEEESLAASSINFEGWSPFL